MQPNIWMCISLCEFVENFNFDEEAHRSLFHKVVK